MEEMLGNVAGARQVFERWMKWEPDHQGWRAYIKMELRYDEVDRARGVYERYVRCHPTVKAWVNYAKFEGKLGERERARQVYETAVRELGLDANTIDLFQKFAQFEEFCKETPKTLRVNLVDDAWVAVDKTVPDSFAKVCLRAFGWFVCKVRDY